MVYLVPYFSFMKLPISDSDDSEILVESVRIYVINPVFDPPIFTPSYKLCAIDMVLEGVIPILVEADLCKVLVIKGAGGLLFVSWFLIFLITKFEFSKSFLIDVDCSSDFMNSLSKSLGLSKASFTAFSVISLKVIL